VRVPSRCPEWWPMARDELLSQISTMIDEKLAGRPQLATDGNITRVCNFCQFYQL